MHLVTVTGSTLYSQQSSHDNAIMNWCKIPLKALTTVPILVGKLNLQLLSYHRNRLNGQILLVVLVVFCHCCTIPKGGYTNNVSTTTAKKYCNQLKLIVHYRELFLESCKVTCYSALATSTPSA